MFLFIFIDSKLEILSAKVQKKCQFPIIIPQLFCELLFGGFGNYFVSLPTEWNRYWSGWKTIVLN